MELYDTDGDGASPRVTPCPGMSHCRRAVDHISLSEFSTRINNVLKAAAGAPVRHVSGVRRAVDIEKEKAEWYANACTAHGRRMRPPLSLSGTIGGLMYARGVPEQDARLRGDDAQVWRACYHSCHEGRGQCGAARLAVCPCEPYVACRSTLAASTIWRSAPGSAPHGERRRWRRVRRAQWPPFASRAFVVAHTSVLCSAPRAHGEGRRCRDALACKAADGAGRSECCCTCW